MADAADDADRYINDVIRFAIEKRQQNAKKAGTKKCKECGEIIPVARRELGFSLCIECAVQAERHESQYADH